MIELDMRKSILIVFILSIFTGFFWMLIPRNNEEYVFNPEVEYELAEGGMEMHNSLNLVGTTDISFELEISSESNFTVIIEYCAFLEVNPINETNLDNLVYGQSEGYFTFFILFVEDSSISSVINSTVIANRFSPLNMTHFSLNASLTDGTSKIQMNVVSHDAILFHSGILVSYTDYISKMRIWVWIFPIILVVLIVGGYGLFLFIKHKKR